jgi:hypothetical protein
MLGSGSRRSMTIAGWACACLLGIESLACGPGKAVSRWTVGPARAIPADCDRASDSHLDRPCSSGSDDAAVAVRGGGDHPPDGSGPVVDPGREDGGRPETTTIPVSAVDASLSDGHAADGSVADGSRVSPDLRDAAVDAVERGCREGTCKRVFVTSRRIPNGGPGSLAAGDATCQMLASRASLRGSWRAWLSDASASPLTRFVHSELPYRLLDGTRVAKGWNALTSGTLEHGIDVFETGRSVRSGRPLEVWTGTTPTGLASGFTCGNWTNDSAGFPIGDVGLTGLADPTWSQAYPRLCDRTAAHLYCFEQ